MTIEVGNPIVELMNTILEDGAKLRSLNQLIQHYELTMPFNAYKARGVGEGKVFTILEYAEEDQLLETPCYFCGGGIINNESKFFSKEVHHEHCSQNRIGGGGWYGNTENWQLA